MFAYKYMWINIIKHSYRDFEMYINQIDFAFKLNYKNFTFISNLDLFQTFS